MTVYRFISTMNTSAGIGSVSTQNIKGGLCRQIFINAGTSTTTFKANVTDDDSLTVRSYTTVTGIVNDTNQPLPVQGTYTIQVTNASADGRFTVLFLVQE